MAIDVKYIPLNSLNSFYVDKDTGLPLAAGKLYFYQDQSRTTPKTVYQISGGPSSYTYTALPNPVNLNSVGTAQNAGGDNVIIYAYPYDSDGDIELYYVQCTDVNDSVQWTREAIPHLDDSNSPINDNIAISNQLSNPQFSRYFLEYQTSAAITVSGNQTTPISPEWNLVTVGSGTVTLTRENIQGLQNFPTNPPFALTVQAGSGVTQCKVVQRLDNNSGLWASEYVATTIVAKKDGASPGGALTMVYDDGGVTQSTLLTAELTTAYIEYNSVTSSPIPNSTNPNFALKSYIDISISIPENNIFSFTSAQVIPTVDQVLASAIPYDQRSSDRELALMGGYYIPQLAFKPIPSYLVGWDFALNPIQLPPPATITSVANASPGQGAYVWDQTICGRTGTNNPAVARDSISDGFQITTTAPTTAGVDVVYMLQYLDGATVKKIITSRLCVNVNAYKSDSANDVIMKVRLLRGSSAATVPTLPNMPMSITAADVITITQASWTEIPRNGLPTAQASLSTVTAATGILANTNDYMFNNWELTDNAQITDTDKFAILLTFQYSAAAQVITVDSVSLMPGDVASRPPPKTYAETLRDCQYYYERSYAPGVASATVTQANSITYMQPYHPRQAASNIYLSFAAPFSLKFKTLKRTDGYTVTAYNPINGTSGQVGIYHYSPSLGTSSHAFSTWGQVKGREDLNATISTSQQLATMTTAGAATAVSISISLHYVIDDRIGVV